MKIFLATLPVFAALWFIMRLMMQLWEKGWLPAWFTPIGGITAWATVLSLAGPVWAVIDIFIGLVTADSYVNAFGPLMELFGVSLIIGLGGKLILGSPEILDYDHVKPFIVDSMQFRGYERRRDDIFEELDKHAIKKVFQETTGKAFPKEMEKKMKSIPHMEPEEALKELERVRAMPLRSVHLQDQLGQLRAGEVADISDSFKLNAVKNKSHDFYDLVSEMKIAPLEKLLSFKIVFPNLTAQTKLDADRVYRLKQELYDLLQALHGEKWLMPYGEHFERIKAVCHRTDTDTFGLPIQQPFFSVEIALVELKQRTGKLFVATDLDKIATVVFEPPGE